MFLSWTWRSQDQDHFPHVNRYLLDYKVPYINVADPAVFILAGTLPIEAEMHIKAITLYGNITRAK
jgi:hypothetical protein